MLSASPSNRSPSVGLTVVDSMAGRRIKGFAGYAQAFREKPQSQGVSDGSRTDIPAAGHAGGSPPPPRGAGGPPASYGPQSAHAPRAPAAGRGKSARKPGKTRSGPG